MQYIADAISGLICSVLSVLIVPTVCLLLLKRFVPILGDELWRGYCQVLAWIVTAPVKLIRYLVHEATSRR